jgi:hypothetical protein
MRLPKLMTVALLVGLLGAVAGCSSRRDPGHMHLHAHGQAHQDTVSPSPFTYGQGGGYGHGYWASGRGYRPFHQSRYRVAGGHRYAYHRNHGVNSHVHGP